ncbi:MAG: DUF4198 domain-containing protein [Amphritea sp.]|nr:DUF4198 domain-containing protein [Amphritea sp.]
MTAQAHPLWVLPGEFVVSGDESSWVTFDVSASHTVFGYDKGVGLQNVQVFSPDGDRNPLGSFFKGHRRSVFDLLLDQDGTYKVFAQRPKFYFTSYKAGNRDTDKRMWADKVEAAERLPENARDVKTMQIDMSSVAYVTRNAPSDSVFQPTGKGFELRPVTHPNDIVQGEEAVLEALLNGKPVAGVSVEITPGGTRYRNERNSIEITTDSNGRIEFTPGQAGPWLLSADYSMPSQSPLADTVEAIRFITFEVIPE